MMTDSPSCSQRRERGISVIMPARNAARFVRAALDSILDQSLPPDEVIVVDDGSSDGTRGIVETAAASSSIPVRIVDGPRTGIAAAHNAGVARASSPWIAIMHADDVAMARRLELQMASADLYPEVVAWGGYAIHVDAHGRSLGLSATGCPDIESFRSAFARRRLTGNIIHSSALFRRSVYDAVGGYDSDFDGVEDLDLFERMAEFGPVIALPEPLIHRRIHDASVSAQSFRRIQRLCREIEFRSRSRSKRDADAADSPRRSRVQRVQRLAAGPVAAVRDTGAYFYHRAGRAYAGRRFAETSAFLALAAVCDPSYSIRRMRAQLGGLRKYVLRNAPPAGAPGKTRVRWS
jgi:glycosyltransferase involved in cell wall biosynthesis